MADTLKPTPELMPVMRRLHEMAPKVPSNSGYLETPGDLEWLTADATVVVDAWHATPGSDDDRVGAVTEALIDTAWWSPDYDDRAAVRRLVAYVVALLR